MNEQLIEKIIPELIAELTGLFFREIIQLADQQFAIAFEGDEFKLLFVAIEPKEPRIYLIKRRFRDLKKEKQNASKFVVDVEKSLAGSRLLHVSKHVSERVVEFRFESGETTFLIVQLTGKSSNIFLIDHHRTITAAARKPLEGEQSLGMKYSPPDTGSTVRNKKTESYDFYRSDPLLSLSESLDTYFLQRAELSSFESLANEARKKNRNGRAKLSRLLTNLEADISQHGDPEKWKKYGDLLLAGRSNATREPGAIVVRDLFDEAAPLISIEADDNDSIPDTAQKYFRKYTKARNAASEIALRIETVKSQLSSSIDESSEIEYSIESRNVDFLENYLGRNKKLERKTNEKKASRLPPGVRSFISSDGFEILVGKKAADNDHLTFRLAGSRDTWMHAADYPGSHVVIRNNDRKEIPQKTLIEAARIAAFYSQGKKQTKAAVNYTEKKFVNKPKGAAPGLVRLASFKTILVEPVFPNVLQK